MIIPISEIFCSLQGEGRNTGKPSIFVRFWGCNLKCDFCDSKYSRHKDYISELQKKSLDKVIAEINEFNCKHIIFTGGEPALFESYIDAIQNELGKDYTFEIETNGSIDLQNHYDQVNVSYKTSNSGNQEYELKALSTGYDYKFVVETFEDCIEVEYIIQRYQLLKDRIYLMPLGTDKDSQVNLKIANYCLTEGYRYCQRMHILLFGNKKGV